MDDDSTQLAKQLYDEDGKLMEDASFIALRLGGSKDDFDPVMIDELRRSANAISALIDAAGKLFD